MKNTWILYTAVMVSFLLLVVDPYRERPLRQLFTPEFLKQDQAQKRAEWRTANPGASDAGSLLRNVTIGLVLIYLFLEVRK
jgi:hypothetical protein